MFFSFLVAFSWDTATIRFLTSDSEFAIGGFSGIMKCMHEWYIMYAILAHLEELKWFPSAAAYCLPLNRFQMLVDNFWHPISDTDFHVVHQISPLTHLE